MTGAPWPDWLQDARTGQRRQTARSRSAPAKQAGSPYFAKGYDKWPDITRGLIAEHPLPVPELVAAVTRAWQGIFSSTIGSGFRIGSEIWPTPQIMGSLLHALIPLELARANDGWRADATSGEKDLVCIRDARFSIEIKTSSHPTSIFGNRSFGQGTGTDGKKSKSGYYLAVNFAAWPKDRKVGGEPPALTAIRFGWLDHSDWMSQGASTGQAATLPIIVENTQLLHFPF